MFNPVGGYRHLEELTTFIFRVEVSSTGMGWDGLYMKMETAVSSKMLARKNSS
jgi:hypothetical protein